jgi:hypothetical protein
MKKFIRLAILLAVIVSLSACSDLLGLYKPVPVSSIAISSGWDGVTAFAYTGQLQLTASAQPDDASNQTVAWSVIDAVTGLPTTLATIDANGILTWTDPSGDDLTVTAAAVDGSGVKASLTIIINGS